MSGRIRFGEHEAKQADVARQIAEAQARFDALPALDQAIHRMDQRRSGIHGLADFHSPVTREERERVIDKMPEFAVLKGLRDARAELAITQAALAEADERLKQSAELTTIVSERLAKAEARCGELVKALKDIGAAIVEQADDTLWVGLGETCVDRIGAMLGIGENSDLDELLLARRDAKALAPAPNGEKGAGDA